jgi:hypothetical protein
VPGNGGVHGGLGSFFVSDLTDQDDVWVHAKYCSEYSCEGHLSVSEYVHRGLVHKRKAILYRVFDGFDVLLGGVDLVEQGV